MSEEERRKRFGYRKKRNRIILFQVAILILTLLTTLVTGIVAYAKDNSYYVNYSEKSTVDYGVILKDNDFYEESFLGKDYAYIASLIDKVQAEFGYNLKMDSQEPINFTYSYRIDAVVQIKNKASGKVIFAPVYNEVAEQTNSCTDNAVKISGFTLIDYAKYNDIANRFIKAYKLDGATAELSLQMHVNVTGMSEEFLNDKSNNSYVSSISIPLSTNTVEVKITSAIPKEEQKILSYTTEDLSRALIRVCIAFAIASAILVAVLWIYAYLSRNIDITYDIKVKKLVRSYKSFIHKLINSFNTDGYQILLIGSFEEMLEIRDTIQSPILMEENGDRTMTKFFIPTNTKLLYVFEIKVDDYDDIYGTRAQDVTAEDYEEYDESLVGEEPIAEFTNEPIYDVEENIEVEVAKAEEVDVVAEAIAEEESSLEEDTAENICHTTPNIIILEPEIMVDGDYDEENASLECIDEAGNKIKIACKRSFTANLIQSNPQIKSYYSEIKNKILSFRGVKSRISWKCDSFNRGRQQLFKIKIRGKTVCLYCALNPDDFDKAKYFHEVAVAKTLQSVPMMVRIKSDRGLKRALGLIDAVMEKYSITISKKAIAEDYIALYPYESTASLVERELVKILIPGAVAAEPLPHHHIHKMPVTVGNGYEEEKTDSHSTETFDEEVVTDEVIATSEAEPEGDNGDATEVGELIIDLNGEGKRIIVACNRSFESNLIQSNGMVKYYYSKIRNKILSYRAVKLRTSWKYETYKKGRITLFKLKIRGKTICLYCALDPNEFERSRFFHEEAVAKAFEKVPMMVRIKSDRGLKRALKLITTVMDNFAITENPKFTEVDYLPEYPYSTTAELVERGLIKLLHPDAKAAEPKPHHHIHKKLVTVEHDDVVEEITIFDTEAVTPEQIQEVAEAPVVTLEEIDYDEGSEPVSDIVEENENGVDIIGVVWPERPHRNKIYRYDPDGETVEIGDTVIVPTRDVSKNRDVVRRAVVAHANHKILPEAIKHPLKKILGIIKTKSE